MTMIRLGLITPSSNTVLEPTVAHVLTRCSDEVAPQVSAHFTRIAVERIGVDADASAQFDRHVLAEAAQLLAAAKVDVLMWGGTSGSWLGAQRDREIAGYLAELTGIPTSTSTLAILDACTAFGVQRLGIATPYLGDVNESIVRCYAEEGIDVVSSSGLGLTENHAFAAVSAERLRQQLREVADHAQAVAVICTNVDGVTVTAGSERQLGIPVIDSVAATVWQALRLAGHPAKIGGFGALLEHASLRSNLQRVCDDLLTETEADRTTLRIDLFGKVAGSFADEPKATEVGIDVDVRTAAAECCAEGIRSIRWDSSLNQRTLNTVQWIEKHRQTLVQPHFNSPPFPPRELIDIYGVQAQMLCPIPSHVPLDPVAGWLSVHSCRERVWGDADVNAIHRARDRIGQITKDLTL